MQHTPTFTGKRKNNYWSFSTLMGVLAMFPRFILGCERGERRIVGVSNRLLFFREGLGVMIKHWPAATNEAFN